MKARGRQKETHRAKKETKEKEKGGRGFSMLPLVAAVFLFGVVIGTTMGHDAGAAPDAPLRRSLRGGAGAAPPPIAAAPPAGRPPPPAASTDRSRRVKSLRSLRDGTAYARASAPLDRDSVSARVRIVDGADKSADIKTVVSNKETGCDVGDARDGYALAVNNWETRDGQLTLEWGDAATGCRKLASGPRAVVAPDRWTHVAFVLSPTTAALFVDGAEVARERVGDRRSPQRTQPLRVAQYADAFYPFVGNISGLVIFDGALTASDGANVAGDGRGLAYARASPAARAPRVASGSFAVGYDAWEPTPEKLAASDATAAGRAAKVRDAMRHAWKGYKDRAWGATSSSPVFEQFSTMKGTQGLFPIYVDPRNGGLKSRKITFGALGDSYYEYLLKTWLQGGRTETRLRGMYDEAMDGMVDLLLQHSSPSNLAYVADIDGGTVHKMDHLVCFLGGVLALGAKTDQRASTRRARDLHVAEALTHLRPMYLRQPTKLAPEFVTFRRGADMVVAPSAPFYILRPETAESLFVLHEVTKNPVYRDWGWEIFSAIEARCRTAHGDGSVPDVRKVTKPDDRMESFFLAETLKYLYLLQDPNHAVDLETAVFNTEAHPLRNIGPGKFTSSRLTTG
ncbi:GTP binding protein [Aureococcus anophagefferens]|nr:GTP binding protein [Aureococcus anophagefferens]